MLDLKTNETSLRVNRYRMFFTRNIRKYIERNLYELQPEKSFYTELKNISQYECERWRKSSIEYLSSMEALALAIHFSLGKEHFLFNDLLFDEVMEYFDWCLRNSKYKKEIHLANLALGVVLFEKGVHSPKRKQRELLSLSRNYLREALKYEKNLELLYVYLTLVEVSSGCLSNAIKYLTKASKVSSNPLPIWRMLASIYKNLKMPEVADFFLMKIDKQRSFLEQGFKTLEDI
ncbi:MAG: hypothetical protein HN576_14195 [Bacteriovoracaceae bacterium]|nr:hypothetical protein [Bacteriovoracaceae bacterium]